MLPVITTEQWRELEAARETDRVNKEIMQEEKKRQREEKKRQKEETKGKKRARRQLEELDSNDPDDPLPLNEEVESIPKRRPKKKAIQPPVDSPTDSVEKYAVNSYVIVQYNSDYFPGKILQRDDVDEEYEVKTMSSTNYGGKKVWKWPEKTDVLYYTKDRIIKSISNPKPFSTSKTAGKRAGGLFVIDELLLN